MPPTWSTPSAVPTDDVVELDLLLPVRQAEALEAAARRRGLTAGQAVRLLIRDFVRSPVPHEEMDEGR